MKTLRFFPIVLLVTAAITFSNCTEETATKTNTKEALKDDLYQSWLKEKDIEPLSDPEAVRHMKLVLYGKHLAMQDKDLDPNKIEEKVHDYMAEELLSDHLKANNLERPDDPKQVEEMKERVMKDYWNKRNEGRTEADEVEGMKRELYGHYYYKTWKAEPEDPKEVEEMKEKLYEIWTEQGRDAFMEWVEKEGSN